jgi:hypothetical protein
MIPRTATVVGEVLSRRSFTDEASFVRECGRLWRETVEVVGCDPVQASMAIRNIVLDPWSSVKHLPSRLVETNARPTPAIMPPRRSTSQ